MSPSRVRIPPSPLRKPLLARGFLLPDPDSFRHELAGGLTFDVDYGLVVVLRVRCCRDARAEIEPGEQNRPLRVQGAVLLSVTMQPPRRGGRAVECGGLENRFGLLGPTRVQIPPPPLNQAGGRAVTRSSACHLAWAELSTR